MADPYKDTQDLYTRVAARWDAERNRKLFEKTWLDRVLERCPANPDILYLGCGAGEPVARYLIEQGAQITGVDFAPTMLDIARDRFPNHTWVQGDIRHIALNKTFDAIVNFSAFFHLTQTDQRAQFAVMADHLNIGGCAFITTGIEAGEGQGTVADEPVYHATLDTAEFATLFKTHGFADIKNIPNDPDCGGYTLWLATKQP